MRSEAVIRALQLLPGILRLDPKAFSAEELLKRLFSDEVIAFLRWHADARVVDAVRASTREPAEVWEAVRSTLRLPGDVSESERADFLAILFAVGEGAKYLVPQWKERDKPEVRQRLKHVMEFHFQRGQRHYRHELLGETLP
jgi:hypothetical protein